LGESEKAPEEVPAKLFWPRHPPGEFSNSGGVGTLEPYFYVQVKEKRACHLWWNGEYVNARGDYYFPKKRKLLAGESVAIISYSDSLPVETIHFLILSYLQAFIYAKTTDHSCLK
jgi:hypothetical protein